MNKLLILTTCITPLLFVTADAKLSVSETSQSIEFSKPTTAKLDQYMRIKCNLPKISDQQIRDIANTALNVITDIQQNISVYDITRSLQKYCVKDSVFGKVIEIAQDLVNVAKTYADFNTVIRLERISNKALDLYNKEGVNFEFLAKNTTDTPEYRKNEDMFKKFISRDLMILRQIVLQYADRPSVEIPQVPVVESKETKETAYPIETESDTTTSTANRPTTEPAITLDKDPALDKKTFDSNTEIQPKPADPSLPQRTNLQML